MKMDVRHALPAPAEIAWRELFSEGYAQASRQHAGADTELISEEALPDGRLFRRSKVTLGKDLPGPAAALLGSKRLTYTLEEQLDHKSYTVQWRVIVDKVADKVSAAGVFRIEPIDERTSTRIVLGDVKVSVPFIGGQIEKGIAAELEKSYEATAAFARQWLTSRHG